METTEADRKVIRLEPGDYMQLLFKKRDEPSRFLITRDDVVLIDLGAEEIIGLPDAVLSMSKMQFAVICQVLATFHGLAIDEVRSHRDGHNCVVVRP
jgi:hypothetical protein